MDYIELYSGEQRAIQYEMYLDNEGFVPESVTIEIYDDNDNLKLSTSGIINTNVLSFTITTALTNTVGKYFGVITLNKSNQIFIKKIKINIK
jgi:hypothetical protein